MVSHLINGLKKYVLLQRQKTVSCSLEAVKLGSVDFYHHDWWNNSVFPMEKQSRKHLKAYDR